MNDSPSSKELLDAFQAWAGSAYGATDMDLDAFSAGWSAAGRTIPSLREDIARYENGRVVLLAEKSQLIELLTERTAALGEALAQAAELKALQEATSDMLDTARLELDMLREALGVSVEPHQSLHDRMIEAARRADEPPAHLAAFKNFHRLLCERFNYVHDEVDWQRDQLSLIEWIAEQMRRAAEPPLVLHPQEQYVQSIEMQDALYELLVRRGYAQHEADHIMRGPHPDPPADDRKDGVIDAARLLLVAMAPIDWTWVFNAPGNRPDSAKTIARAVRDLELAIERWRAPETKSEFSCTFCGGPLQKSPGRPRECCL